MAFIQKNTEIIENKEIAKGFFSLWLNAPDMAAQAAPGQFAHIRCGDKSLRRPISICGADTESGRLRLVYEIRGEGTKWLSEQAPGYNLDVIAPLGKGFDFRGQSGALFIGGGIGSPPMLCAAKAFPGKAFAALGFRNKSAVILEQDFADAGIPLEITTDDGSYGYHGLVTHPAEERLKSGGIGLVCVCGPAPMLRGGIELAKRYNTACQVSLEQRMGCGVGACRVCAVKVRDKQKDIYMHVCLNGPVFDINKFDVQI